MLGILYRCINGLQIFGGCCGIAAAYILTCLILIFFVSAVAILHLSNSELIFFFIFPLHLNNCWFLSSFF